MNPFGIVLVVLEYLFTGDQEFLALFDNLNESITGLMIPITWLLLQDGYLAARCVISPIALLAFFAYLYASRKRNTHM